MLPATLGLIGLLAGAPPAAGQEAEGAAAPSGSGDPSAPGSFAGTVRDAETGDPLAGAAILLAGTGVATVSEDDGSFLLVGVPPGSYPVVVRAAGYAEQARELRIEAAGETRVAVDLRPEGARDVDAGEVRVATNRPQTGKLAGFLERSKSGDGQYITQEQIEAANASRVSDLFRRYSSLRVEQCLDRDGLPLAGCTTVFTRYRPSNRLGGGPRRSRAEGGASPTTPLPSGPGEAQRAVEHCEPVVWVDGARLGPSQGGAGIDFLSPGDIAGIEIYKVAATAPARYGAGAICGVVLIWTRSPGDEQREPDRRDPSRGEG